jgi:hypothetical protein
MGVPMPIFEFSEETTHTVGRVVEAVVVGAVELVVGSVVD